MLAKRLDVRLMLKALRMSVGLSFLAMFTGCVQQTTNGPSIQFQYETWIPMTLMFVGICVAAVGWQTRERSNRVGWGTLIFGLICSFLIAPSIFRDQVTVTPSGFSVQAGFWGLTDTHDVKFDEIHQLRSVEVVSRSSQTSRRRGSKTRRYLICERRDGGSHKVSADSQVMKSALELITQQAVARGITISNEN